MKQAFLPTFYYELSFKILFVFIIFFLTPKMEAQSQLPALLDSLASTTSDNEKARLSMKIASNLANDDWERTIYYIDVAENIATRSGSDKILAKYRIAVAEIYSNKGAWDIALDHLLKAYEYYINRPLKERYRLENDLAIAFAETDNHEKALEFFKKLYRYEHTSKNPINLASLSNNIGLVWMKKDVDSSMYYFKNSLKLIENIDYPYLKVFLYTNLGKCSFLQGDDKAAKHYFNLAIDQVAPNAVDEDLAWVYGEFSELYLKNEKLDSAIFYSKRAVDIYDSIAPYRVEQLQAMKVLYKSYIKNRQFEKATHYFERSQEVLDSLNIEDQRINVQKILVEEEYRNLLKIRDLEESKHRLNIYGFILGLTIVLLILAIFLFRYHTKVKRIELEKQLEISKKGELKKDLELKSKELIGKAMVEMHRTEIIEDVLKDLKSIKLKSNKKEVQNAIEYIAKRLKGETSSYLWEEFQINFEQVHESFYKKLIALHPDLSPREKRLCALLKLNLTSKEIAQITGQTTKSVENSRTRLRKKLNITNSQTDLSSYLSSFG